MKSSDGGLIPLRPGDELAVEAADQEIVGPELGAALVDRLDEKGLAVRQSRADMAAIAEDAEIVEEERVGRDLLAEPQRLGFFDSTSAGIVMAGVNRRRRWARGRLCGAGRAEAGASRLSRRDDEGEAENDEREGADDV